MEALSLSRFILSSPRLPLVQVSSLDSGHPISSMSATLVHKKGRESQVTALVFFQLRWPDNMNRDDVIASLQEVLVPALRKRGFKGSLPHFRRIKDGRVDLFTVQFDRHGGGFIVEISRCSSAGVTTRWGKHIPANKVCAHDLHPNERHRLGSPGPGVDGRWFRFDDGTPAEEVVDAAAAHLEEADRWWAAG